MFKADLGATFRQAIGKALILLLFLSVLGCSNNFNKKTAYTQQDILQELEAYNQETFHFFINLEHPYFLTAGSRLSLYADDKRWALVFEKSGYANRGYRGELEISYFGNCLENLHAEGTEPSCTSNTKYVTLIDNDEIERIEAGTFELVPATIKQVKVRDMMLDIEHDIKKYQSKQIKFEHYKNPDSLVDIPSLIRFLDEEHPEVFRATESELRMCLPKGLPKLMSIDHWHHESYYEGYGTKPSDYETYKLIADILVTKDVKKWKPTLKPNNDWRNWPMAGYM